MEGSTQIFLFGDQTNSYDAGLCHLLQIKDNPLLSALFERVNYALRLHIGQLPSIQKELFPRFTSLHELLARYRETSDTNPALDSMFVCLHQLALFISSFGGGLHAYPAPKTSNFVGLCIGLLPAAAISTAQTVVELLPAAVEAVMIAFRIGLRTFESRNLLGQGSEVNGPWSAVVGIQEKQALAALTQFCEVNNIPDCSSPYISVINANSVTISGPPGTLDQLLTSSSFLEFKPIKVSVYAPYHASHIYTMTDVDNILSHCSNQILESYIPRIPLLSNVTGQPILASNYATLLQNVLREILIEPIRWTTVLEGCAAVLRTSEVLECTVLPIATNAYGLVSALSQHDKVKVKLDPMIANVTQTPPTLPTPGRPEQSKIAIIGYSGRFPDAASAEEFWDLLYKGLDVHRDIPPDRFDLQTHFDPTGKKKNTSTIRHGCWIENPGLFDARFFQMSPREADNTDPGQRLALITAYEAMEMAGFVPNRTPSTQRDRVGMFYGMTSDDWREVNSGQNIDTYFIPGGNRAFTPGRINYNFKFSGPSLSIDSACSSSFAAIHTACNALWRGDCDTAIAGGTNVMTNPDNFAGLDRGHFLSKTGNCNTFDDAADGYCRADGVGTIILKRLEDAIADNDPIQGVILGAYTNHSAEAVSMTRPHSGAQAYIFSKLLNESNIDPLSVSYIEMHGTGTQAGDATEMKSVLEVFSPAGRNRSPAQSLHLGSAKSNVGHAESASGVISMVKVLLMLEKNQIPPHPGIKTKINHTFPTDLRERNIHIAMKPTPWQRRSGEDRRVFLNNFSAAGGNTAILMEDAPIVPANKTQDPRSTHMLAISAKSISSLKNNIQALVDYVDKNQNTPLASLSYTTTARRMHHNHRVLVTGSNLLKMIGELQTFASQASFKPVPAKAPTVSFVFTAQGALYAGMGKELYRNFSQYRTDIQQFDTICQGLGFPSIVPLLDGSLTDDDETSPLVAQLGTTCMQMALARLWASWGVKPAVVVGHSLGEYAALNAAGVLSISDTIYLVGKRAQLLQERCTMGSHGMLAVKASVATIQARSLGKHLEIACVNGPEDTVLSGTNHDIDAAEKELSRQGFRCIKPRLPFAFHSAHVDPILEAFETAVAGVTFHKPSVPVISPLLGKVITDATTFGAKYLSQACRGTVNFVAGLNAAQEENFGELWLELGPHPICSGMIRSTLGDVTIVPSIRRKEDIWKVLATSVSTLHLAGLDIHWDEYHRDFPGCHEVIRLPAYRWDYKNHWIQYVHDWCLTKGDAVPPPVDLEPVKSKLCTPSVQRIVEEHIDTYKASITIESDLSEPTLNAAIQGHKVNGAALCPSSLYADIAFTLGDYLLVQSGCDTNKTAMDISKMVVDKPLIARSQPTSRQLFRVSVNADWISQTARVQLYSVTDEGKKSTDHAKCIIKFVENNTWLEKWKRNEYLIQARIDRLHSGVEGGQSHKIKRGMAYKLFSAFVEYDQRYRGMEEVTLDSAAYEATARVKFQASEKDGNYYFSPYWIDSLGQLSGFTMNANDVVDSKTQVFVNHGWESMRCAKRFSVDKTYQTYVKMQNVGGTMFSGDVYILEEGTIVAVFRGSKFQGVPRKVIDFLLPPGSGTQNTKSSKAGGNLVSNAACRVGMQKVVSIQETRSVVDGTKPKPNDTGIVSKALAIVADEIGLNVNELAPESRFADLGVDSLLSLTIVGRFREELNKDFESSFFFDNPSVTDLMRCFSQDSTQWSDSSESNSIPQYTPGPGFEGEDEQGILGNVRQALAEEIGIPAEEIKGTMRLAELGMDSLLALTVRGRLQEELSIELPSDILLGDATLDSIAQALGLTNELVASHANIPSSSLKKPVAQVQPVQVKPAPRATSILLQGNPATAKKILFLFPDGSGSSTSYASIPKLGDDIAVFGLNCPWLKTPQEMPKNLSLLTGPFLEEILRRQPTGPYNLGGWSAGGVCAYDAAQCLNSNGAKVERLVLLDSPCPVGIGKLPTRIFEFFKKCGLFGCTEPPEWLLPHFLAFIDALDGYNAVPFAADRVPKTFILWATDGVCKYPGDARPVRSPGDPAQIDWLLENRTDFGPNGWEFLLGATNLEIHTLGEANHFTMMKDHAVIRLGEFMRKAMN
ncbi:conidial pigment polyketide synthase PksP/Alb1 [Terfezia boudieri ATCC MYA-4762]|uniref:Conidial pigment polyketide synthase PksP/Alb1 n=1 Tax=Terfezia boudieri ATCC MYA-4762 TaxID=1051890 RepID=A0A3N4MBJ8_9PEZI|nr:conidial pigment polyketide synthase PksP/Alb1 [Terfezia boudieri ATCC MYA-4762]